MSLNRIVLNEIAPFLKKNGFEMTENYKFVNGKCSVTVKDHGDPDDAYYTVANNNGDAMYSKDVNIYWLIGILVYYNYVDEIKK